MGGWESSRDTIGQNRTWILGRAAGGVWALTVGLSALVVGLFIVLGYAVVEAVYTLALDRPLNIKRAWAYALFMYGVAWLKYPIAAGSYPGLIPRAEHGRR